MWPVKRSFSLQSLCLIAAAALVTPMLPAPQAAAGDNARWSVTFGNSRGYSSSRYDRSHDYRSYRGYDRYRYRDCDRYGYRRVAYRPVYVHYDRPRYRDDYRQHRWDYPGLRFDRDRYDRSRRGWWCD